MAFTASNLRRGIANGLKVLTVSYANTAGSTGGTIRLPINKIWTMNSSSATSTPSSVLTASGSVVTITTTANQTGTLLVTGV